MKKAALTLALLLGGALTSMSVMAAQVDFPPGQANGSFNCTVSNLSPDAVIKVDTQNLDANGFCGGPYVTSKGHLEIPAANAPEVFKTYYFEIKKNISKAGSVSITLKQGTGNITCGEGHGSATTVFGDGNYCKLPPINK